MLNIQTNRQGDNARITLQGRLDTTTAPELEAALPEILAGTAVLTLDLAGLEYISSAGLRVLLSAQKAMNKQGSMTVAGVSDAIREIFDVTGFSDILTIE